MAAVARVIGPALLLCAGACAGGAGGPAPRFRTLAELREQQQADSVRRAEAAAAHAGPTAEPVTPVPARDSASQEPASPGAGHAPAPATRASRTGQEPVRQGKWIRVGPNPPRIDLPLFDAPVADVASYIAERVGVDIVVSSDPDVRATRLTGEIRDRYWHEALESMLEAHGLRAIQAPSGIITIVSAREANRGRRPELINLQFRDARDVVAALQPMFEGAAADSTAPGSVEVMGDPEISRTLVVYGSADQVAAIREVVEEYDRRPANVSIEAWMLLVNRSAMDRRGVSYSFVPVVNDSTGGQSTGVNVAGSGASSIPGLTGSAFTLRRTFGNTPIGLNVFIDALTSAGFAETETRPLVMTTSEREGKINVGDSYILPNPQPILAGGGVIVPGAQNGLPGTPATGGSQEPGAYPRTDAPGAAEGTLATVGSGGFAQFLTGTTLRVTPIVLEGGRQVRMKVDLVRDGGTLSPDGRSITGGRHSTTTEVIVDDQTPIVIGSFTVQGHARASSGVPLLGSLPVLGRLFRRDEVSSNYMDLVIVLVPHVHHAPDRSAP
ncbi:secretin N-terminal domain-containing protein [Longimicrobium sp.]|uniref:secretin N-terminal domain-containing protein n=1 Tax=Longimicrobium sp. TaxID=2029185 RepID=UPI002E3102A4|nr:secretin N-terminal domain-containing protein [Longimicrobium sp.]